MVSAPLTPVTGGAPGQFGTTTRDQFLELGVESNVGSAPSTGPPTEQSRRNRIDDRTNIEFPCAARYSAVRWGSCAH